MIQQPTLGRVVHVGIEIPGEGSQWRAAHVIGVHDDDDLSTPGLKRIEAFVMATTKDVSDHAADRCFQIGQLEYSEECLHGRWTWPPRV